ncbi:C-X-C chemokine receptor type 2-like [Rhinophrynus dorsalis]
MNVEVGCVWSGGGQFGECLEVGIGKKKDSVGSVEVVDSVKTVEELDSVDNGQYRQYGQHGDGQSASGTYDSHRHVTVGSDDGCTACVAKNEEMSKSIVWDGSFFEDIDFNYSYTYPSGIPTFDSAPCKNPWTINKYFVVVVYSLVFFLSVVGNSLVVLVICYNNLKRSSTDVYLLHLAIADLLFAVTLPIWAAYKASEWVFGLFMCKAVSVLQEVNFYSGILLLACISVDRYLAIVHATESVTQKRHWVKFICIGIWIFSFAISVPSLLFRTVFTVQNSRVCHDDIGHEKTEEWIIILRIGRHLVGFFIPLLIMTFCYGFTIKTLYQTKSSQKHRAMRVILAVVLVFLICWLPHNVTVIVDSLLRTNFINDTCVVRQHLDSALSVTEFFGYMHSCINPILYAFIGQKFRNSFLRILVNKGIIRKDFLARYGRSTSFGSTSGNTSTTL